MYEEKQRSRFATHYRGNELCDEERGFVLAWMHDNQGKTSTEVFDFFDKHFPNIARCLTTRTLRHWAAGLGEGRGMSKKAGSGRPRVLSNDFRVQVVASVKNYMAEGCPMNGVLCRSICLTIARGGGFPGLVALLQNGVLTISERWCRQLLAENHLPSRAITGTRRKELDDTMAKEMVEGMVDRIQELVQEFHIPRKLLLHWDQTGITLVSVGKRTRALVAAKHVRVLGFGEKRQVTATPFVTAAGDLLAMQVIFKGKSSACLPVGFQAYEAEGLLCRHSETHWTTVGLQKDFLMRAAEPFLSQHVERCGFAVSQVHFILLLDVYSTHISDEFIGWFKERYNGVAHPHGHLVFVPANLTGVAQPADLTMQSKIKEIVRQHSVQHVAKAVRENSTWSTRLDALKPALMEALMHTVVFWKSLPGGELIRKGFSQAGIDRAFTASGPPPVVDLSLAASASDAEPCLPPDCPEVVPAGAFEESSPWDPEDHPVFDLTADPEPSTLPTPSPSASCPATAASVSEPASATNYPKTSSSSSTPTQ